MGQSVHCHSRVMGLGHAEFMRGLQPLLAQRRWRRTAAGVWIQLASGQVEIRLGAEQSHGLGALVLPRTAVTLEFREVDDEGIDDFLRRFDLSFRRGGG